MDLGRKSTHSKENTSPSELLKGQQTLFGKTSINHHLGLEPDSGPECSFFERPLRRDPPGLLPVWDQPETEDSAQRRGSAICGALESRSTCAQFAPPARLVRDVPRSMGSAVLYQTWN